MCFQSLPTEMPLKQWHPSSNRQTHHPVLDFCRPHFFFLKELEVSEEMANCKDRARKMEDEPETSYFEIKQATA